PTARATLNVTEFITTACATSSRGTSDATSAICAGCESARTTPSAAAKPITTRDELAEVEDAEQERRVRQAGDEDRGGEVLEPRAAGRRGVADEVRAEVARAKDAERARSAPLS